MTNKERVRRARAAVAQLPPRPRTPEEKALVDQYIDILIGDMIFENRPGREPPQWLRDRVREICKDDPPESPAVTAMCERMQRDLEKSLGTEQPEERKAALPVHVRPPSERPKPPARPSEKAKA